MLVTGQIRQNPISTKLGGPCIIYMTLIVRPLKGYLTHDTNFFTSMDPYCYIYLGKQAQKSSPHYGGGLRPSWKETLKFRIDNITKLGIQIWAKALIGRDTLIGQGMIDIRKVNLTSGAGVQQYVDISFDGKPAGRVLLQIEYFANQQNGQLKKQQHGQKVRSQIGWNYDRRPQRQSWTGDIDWRGSNVTDKQNHHSSAIVGGDGVTGRENVGGFNAGQNIRGDFKRKPSTGDVYAQEKQHKISEQEAANLYLNQQVIKNFVNVPHNKNPAPSAIRPQTTQNQGNNYQQHLIQQQMHNQHGHNQDNKNVNGAFGNLGNQKPSTGLIQGTVYAQPNSNHNSHRRSNIHDEGYKPPRGSNVGLGSTPPKSILTPNKNHPKSPGNKKVKFADS